MKNKYKGLLVEELIIFDDFVRTFDERYETLGSPIFNRKGAYYLKDGTHWVEDGNGNALFFKKNAKSFRDYLVKLHLTDVRCLSDKEFLATKYIIQAKLPGHKKLREFMFFYLENRLLEEIRRNYSMKKIFHRYPVPLSYIAIKKSKKQL